MSDNQKARLTSRRLDELRMLADWQLRELGYELAEITRLCLERDRDNEYIDACEAQEWRRCGLALPSRRS